MTKFLATAAAALLMSAPVWAQSAATHTSSSKVTTTNGKVTAANSVKKTASCRNEKNQFIKCASSVKTSTTATIVKDSAGKCRFAAGPNKGKFTKCP